MVKDELKEFINIDEKTNYTKLLIKARQIDAGCSDFIIDDMSKAYFDDELNFNYVSNGEYRSINLNKYALGQLCNKLGISSKYINKCIEKNKLSLFRSNMNTWLKDCENEKMVVREFEGSARGIVSTRFSKCDTPHVLKSIGDIIDFDEYKIKGAILNEERFHLRMIKNEPLKVKGQEDDLFAGLSINSSDVGRSILKCEFFIYKQICTNGLVVSKGKGTLYKQRHIGIDIDEFKKEMRSSLENYNRLVIKSTDGIKELINRNVLLLEKSDILSELKKELKLSEKAQEKIKSLMAFKYGESKWGLINAITEVAQDYEIERRIELENYAGRFLDI